MPKILIADDSDIMRKIAKISLEKGGFNIIEASNGVEALEKASAEKPDLIILDAEMPEMDGWEACKAIKAIAELKAVPVFMCTGHDLSEELNTLTEVGADGFITKPYDVNMIIEKVNKALNK
jgi:CheY-like chemotaxis protein